MMATVHVLFSIATIMISFIAGFIFFYITSTLSKTKKKLYIEEIISLIVNFIIYIWIGKIIINFSIFIRDPLAVLAYPSNSNAFYIAILLIILNVLYKIKRHRLQIEPLFVSFLPIFLVANFVYEFIQIVWYRDTLSLSYLALLMILIILQLMLAEKIPEKITYILLLGWGIGQLVLNIFLPYTSVFNFIMAPWFLTAIVIVTLFLFIIHHRKRVS